MGKRVLIAIGVFALVVLAAGGGYFYGVSVGEDRATQARQQLFGERFGGQNGQFPTFSGTPPAFSGPSTAEQGGGTGLAGAVSGTIEAIEGNTLIVNTEEGSVQVLTSDTTLIEKTKSVGVEDLEVGERVMIAGSRDEDGNVTARSIQSLRNFQLPQNDQQ
ncbi:MAG: hypothetical protein A2Y73_07780 [Chloroflexi bacterium RBG_13_56_8]|nr:MAG: hypothetical protein A2Y73_07780 [Chloroflexi bacterium RBG_13_56_8]